MSAIHAVYENGVFRPLEAVDLPEATEVVFEPRPVVPAFPGAPRPRVFGLHRGAAWIGEDFDQPLPGGFWLGSGA